MKWLKRSPDLVELREDPRYRVIRWPAGNTIGYDGPCPNRRYVAQFQPDPYSPAEIIGTAQLAPRSAADLCIAHRMLLTSGSKA